MVIIRKIILIVFIIFSLLILGYGIAFIIDYYLIIKYSIEDCLPFSSDRIFEKSERIDEIYTLINYAKVVIVYVFYALLLAIYYAINSIKK